MRGIKEIILAVIVSAILSVGITFGIANFVYDTPWSMEQVMIAVGISSYFSGTMSMYTVGPTKDNVIGTFILGLLFPVVGLGVVYVLDGQILTMVVENWTRNTILIGVAIGGILSSVVGGVIGSQVPFYIGDNRVVEVEEG